MVPVSRSSARAVASAAAVVLALVTQAPASTASASSAPAAAPTGSSAPSDLSTWGVGMDRPDPLATGDTAAEPAARTASADATETGTAAAAGAASWVVRGAGWGHSLGMSQYGAWEMAKDGRTAAQILGHYYSGTTYDLVPDDVVVRVNVLAKVSTVTAVSSALSSGGGAFTVTVPSTGSPVMSGSLGDTVTLTRSSTLGVVASCSTCDGATQLTGSFATLRWDTTAAADRTAMSFNGNRYRDGFTVVNQASSGSTLEVVNHVRLHDEYLDYLREMPYSWSVEALKAQAAAARGYALRRYEGGVRSSCACHLLDTSADQVYGTFPTGGDLTYWPKWREAVRASGSTTTGYVVRSGGTVIQAFYSSSHGGRSENNEDVWGGTPLSFIRGVSDPWSLRSSNPRASWRLVPSGSTVASAFGLPDVVRVDLRDRTVNGGVHTATATSGSGARATITGEQLRTRLNIYSIAVRHLTTRLSGDDRYATGAAVAATVAPSATSVVLAAGDSALVDAAVAGPLAGTLGAPLLLTREGSLPAPTVAELNRRGSTVRTAYVIGGTNVVSESVVASLRSRGLSVVRVAGSDRYGTSEAVAAQIAARRTVSGIVVAGGNGLVDALGVSGAANATKEPILLTPAAGLAAATERALTTTKATHARVVGGETVVGPAVVGQLSARGMSVVRLAGSDRYASSAAVADFYRTRVPSTTQVVLTSGADDALVDSLVAGSMGRLLVLTSRNGLVEEAARTLQSTPDLDTVTAVGGTGTVPASVLTAAARS